MILHSSLAAEEHEYPPGGDDRQPALELVAVELIQNLGEGDEDSLGDVFGVGFGAGDAKRDPEHQGCEQVDNAPQGVGVP